MTRMAAMPVYGKNLKKISSPEPIDGWMTLKLGMYHCLCKYYQDCSNIDTGLTLTHFMPRSDLGKGENYYFLAWLFSKKTSKYCHSPGVGVGVIVGGGMRKL